MLPPRAERIPHPLTVHGDTRVDEYYWLNQREDPKVLQYLQEENEYTQTQTAHTQALREDLFEEIKGRIVQTDQSVPYRLEDYFYYSRTEDEKEYGIFCRRKGSIDADEEVMLDLNRMAQPHDYYDVKGLVISSGQNLLAYAEDTVGRRVYSIRFKDLDTGATLPDQLPMATGSSAWANDNQTIFYTRQHPTTLRSYQVWRHSLGTDASEDVLVYEEEDETFSLGVHKTKSKRFLMIHCQHTLRSEVLYLEANDPAGEFQILQPRSGKHEYDASDFRDYFYIRTNDGAENFRLMRTLITTPGRDNWEDVVPHDPDALLEDFELFDDYLVIEDRRRGLSRLRILPWDGTPEHEIEFDEPAYTAGLSANPSFDTHLLRFAYSSMTTPGSIYDYDMESRERRLLKRDEVLGGFDPDHYATERLEATAPDGALVPISLVYRKDKRADGGNPLYLYGYGSYGITVEPSFSSARVSLLDRGFIVALGHIRGGEELGRAWYEHGKKLEKKNTFTDFIACAEHLVATGHARPNQLYAGGGSAGGLLVGAVMNMRPELFHGVLAQVPFVDVVTTMLDDSIPLTTGEYDEWGNPNDPLYYEYMLSYSPYDNVQAAEYPNLLVTAGLHDSQVQYWEPAKWVAKLRVQKTDEHRLLLKTDMDAGHGGVSGRYRGYRDIAFHYAFLIDLAASGD